MKRRQFIKSISAAAGATLLFPSAGSMMTSCASSPAVDGKWDFDEILDRFGTWSIKYDRVSDGQIPMWIADMDFRTAPAISLALKERLGRDVLGYTSAPEAFYESIVDWETKMHHWSVQKEWVAYCPGVITSINQAYLAFTRPGDSIIVQPPVYDHFRKYAEQLGRRVVDNPLIFDGERYRMDFDGLDRLLVDGAKILILCNPHNPCGIVWDKETLCRLASMCRQRGVIVISDEIHGDLTMPGKRHIPFCSVSDDAASIGLVFTGPTKAFNLAGIGMTAYCVIPNDELRETYLKQLNDTKLNEAPLASLVSTITAYTQGEPWLQSLREYLKSNVQEVVDFFSNNDLGIKAIKPEASFLVWLDCRSMGLPQDELMRFFSDKAKLLLSNGASYGPGGEGFVRMNIGCPRSLVKEALSRIHNA